MYIYYVFLVRRKTMYSYLKQTKTSFLFYKTVVEYRRAEQVLSEGLLPVGRERWERVWEGEYGANVVNTCM
jgi:hypothetical protein